MFKTDVWNKMFEWQIWLFYFKGDTYLSFKLNDNVLPESVTHAFNVSTQEAEPQELGVWVQCGLHSEFHAGSGDTFLNKQIKAGWWWYAPSIPALGRQRPACSVAWVPGQPELQKKHYLEKQTESKTNKNKAITQW